MIENNEFNPAKPAKKAKPILKIYRLNYVKVSGKILESTKDKLDKYIEYASENMDTAITSGDCLEHALSMLFTRDSGFKKWLKNN